MSNIKSAIDPFFFDILCDYDLGDYVFEDISIDELQIRYPNDADWMTKVIYSTRSKYLYHAIMRMAKEDKGKGPQELRTFLERILPQSGNDFYLFAKESENVCVNIPQKRKEHIDTLCAIADIPYTLYYHLTPFTEWTADRFAVCFRSICIDIDGFDPGFDILTCDEKRLLDYLTEAYNLHDKPKPDAICCSGNGCHLYFQIPQINESGFEKRQRYLDSILTYFSGDVCTNNKCRKFRLPLSHNRKKGKDIKSRLILFDEPTDISFERLDPYLMTQEEIAAYRSAENDIMNEKKEKTRTENKIKLWIAEGYSREEAEELVTNPPPKQKMEKAPKAQKAPKAKKPKIKESADEYYFDFSDLTYRRNYNGKGPAAILLVDLHNFLVRNGEDALRGCRNCFFLILATAGLEVFTKDRMDDFIDYCETYCDKDNPFYEEMCRIIRSVFSREKVYHFKYETIRKWLNLSETDIRESKSCFTKEIRTERRKKYNHEYYEKTKNTTTLPPTKQRKKDCQEYMKNNPQAKEKEVRNKFGIGHNTFHRYKKELQL